MNDLKDIRNVAALRQLELIWDHWLPRRFPLFKYLSKVKAESIENTERGYASSQPKEEVDIERGEEEPLSEETVLYLAYGSNLSAETFLGKRGIKPISQMNVVVPSLTLTFDLAGLPYSEPCFANTARRQPSAAKISAVYTSLLNEKTPLLAPSQHTEDYHKNRWHKGLVGVLYELTPSDYAHVIATEGGGASYHDVLVECHPLLSCSPDIVPEFPTTPPILAHTLFAPALPDNPDQKNGGRVTRPDPAYAQASARYLKLITDGAAEHALPTEYRAYLEGIQPYIITSQKQRLGQFIFLSLWLPVIGFIFGVQGLFADEHGRFPEWLVQLTSAAFVGVWASYDSFFKNLFGDGERTVKKGDQDGFDIPTQTYTIRQPQGEYLTEKTGVIA